MRSDIWNFSNSGNLIHLAMNVTNLMRGSQIQYPPERETQNEFCPNMIECIRPPNLLLLLLTQIPLIAMVGNSTYYVLVWNARILSRSLFQSMLSFVHELMNLFVCFLVPSPLLFDPQSGTLHAAPIGWEVQFSTDFLLILVALIQH